MILKIPKNCTYPLTPKDNNIKIWDEWADENGELGPIYGSQWRSWKTIEGKSIDQIHNLIDWLSIISNSVEKLIAKEIKI